MKDEFIQLALTAKALKFGDFTLKSGLKSKYFFNLGEFNTGAQLSALCRLYAQKIVESNLEFDMLFGPAYKGIPLVTGVSIALANIYNKDYPIAFNRKEAKTHGEGGNIIGSAINGRALIIDDVITRGTATVESINLITEHNATVAGVIVAVDRKELMPDGVTIASDFILNQYGVKVDSIADANEILQRQCN